MRRSEIDAPWRRDTIQTYWLTSCIATKKEWKGKNSDNYIYTGVTMGQDGAAVQGSSGVEGEAPQWRSDQWF